MFQICGRCISCDPSIVICINPDRKHKPHFDVSICLHMYACALSKRVRHAFSKMKRVVCSKGKFRPIHAWTKMHTEHFDNG